MSHTLNLKSDTQLNASKDGSLLTPSESILYNLRKRTPHSCKKEKTMVPYTKLSKNYDELTDSVLGMPLDYDNKPESPNLSHTINQYYIKDQLYNSNSTKFASNIQDKLTNQYSKNYIAKNVTASINNDQTNIVNTYNPDNDETPLISIRQERLRDLSEVDQTCSHDGSITKHTNILSTLSNGNSCLKPSANSSTSRSNGLGDEEETSFTVALQIFFPYLVAGFGTVGAGMVLDIVQHWPVFKRINELFILVPSLLGLKGNLEMTLASRLSTQANLGTMDQEPIKIYERPRGRSITNTPALVHNKTTSTNTSAFVNHSYNVSDQTPLNNVLLQDQQVEGEDQNSVLVIGSNSRLNEQAKNKAGKSQNWALIGGNLALVQGQAAIIGFLASITALVMGWFPTGQFDIDHAKILCASSILTASLASAILGVLMVVVVVLSRKLYLNPDNIATPIAASLGDLITLALLGFISKHISEALESNPWIFYVVILLYTVLTPVWLYMCSRNEYTREVLRTGWGPIIYSMLISSGGGFILDFTVHKFRGIAVFQPVINGVGGNLAAIQASRLSTWLHKLPKWTNKSNSSRAKKLTQDSKCSLLNSDPNGFKAGRWPSFRRTFLAQDINSKTARILILLVVPGHLIFMYTISYMNAGHTTITPLFALVYLLAALIQVTVLLYLTEWMVNRMWVKGIDPDNAAIPYITAIGDLIGTGLLALAFFTLWTIGDKDSDLGD